MSVEWNLVTNVGQQFTTNLERSIVGRVLKTIFIKLLKEVRFAKNIIERRAEIVYL